MAEVAFRNKPMFSSGSESLLGYPPSWPVLSRLSHSEVVPLLNLSHPACRSLLSGLPSGLVGRYTNTVVSLRHHPPPKCSTWFARYKRNRSAQLNVPELLGPVGANSRSFLSGIREPHSIYSQSRPASGNLAVRFEQDKGHCAALKVPPSPR